MNSYAKVRAPGLKSSKGKNQHKESEISINFKQPFKLSKSPIDQPKIKVNNPPSVVHIIQRKSHKKQPQKTERQPRYIHVIQPSLGKKGWKFNINDAQDEKSYLGQKSQKSSKKQSEKHIQIPQKQPLQVQQVFLHDMEQNILNTNQKITYQRNLERPSHILSPQSSFKSSESIKYEESSAHYLDIGESNVLDQIEIQAIVQNYLTGKKEFYCRKLMNNHQEWSQNNEKIGHIDSLINNDDNVIQIYELNEEINNVYDRIQLKRNLQNQKQGQFHQYHAQVIVSQSQISNNSYFPLQIDIQEIDENYHEKCQYILIPRKLVKVQGINNEGLIYQRNIIIPEEVQQNQRKILPTHKRMMNHKNVQQEYADLKIQSKLNQPFHSQQQIQISQVRQGMNQSKKQSKLSRKLIILNKAEDGILYQKTIHIPQQVNQYKQLKAIPPHQRNMTHNQALYEEESEVHEQSYEQKVQNRFKQDIFSQGIEINPIQQHMKSVKKKPMFVRKLLVMQDIDGKILNQQILIPQDFQQKNNTKVASKLKRQFKIIQYEDQQPKSLINPPHISDIKQQDIIIQQLDESYPRESLKQSIKRNLLIINDPFGQSHYQQIVIPQQFQIRQAKLSSINHKRLLQRQLSQNEPYKEQKLNSKVLPLLSVEDSLEINVDQLRQDYVSKIEKIPLLQRKLLLVKDKKDQNEYQSIIIPVGQEINPNKTILQSHKRTMKHLQVEEPINDKAISEKVFQSVVREYPISKNVEIQQIFQGIASSKQKQLQIRNLQIIQRPEIKVPSQQIIISQQFQQNSNQKVPLSTHKRQFNIIQFQDKPKIDRIQSEIANKSSINDNIEISSMQEEYIQSKKQQKIIRNLLVTKDNNGDILSQEILIPQAQEALSKGNNLALQKRQFKIIQLQEQPLPQQQKDIIDQNQYKQQKLNSKLPPPREQYEQTSIPINEFQEETYQNSQKDSLGRPKLKRALLVIKNEDGQIFSQEIMIPNEEFQINQRKQAPQTYLRNVKPIIEKHDENIEQSNQQINQKDHKMASVNKLESIQAHPQQQQIKIEEQVQNKPIKTPPMVSRRQVKPSPYQQIPKDQKLNSSLPQMNQSIPQRSQPNNSLQNPSQSIQKSLNPSTMNSSAAAVNIILVDSFMEESNRQAKHKPLLRHLEKQPQLKLFNSARQDKNNEKKFNVYSPSDYLSKSFAAIQLLLSRQQKVDNKVKGSLPSPIPESPRQDNKKFKAFRRPGAKSPQP